MKSTDSVPDNVSSKAHDSRINRRRFVGLLLGGAAGLLVPKLLSSTPRGESSPSPSELHDPLAKEIAAMSEQEMKDLLMSSIPVLPEEQSYKKFCEQVKDQWESAGKIPGRFADVVGNSTCKGVFETLVDGTAVFSADESEQAKRLTTHGLVQSDLYFGLLEGGTIDQFLDDPTWCGSENSSRSSQKYASGIVCLPNKSTFDSLVEAHHPYSTVNFWGSNESWDYSLDIFIAHMRRLIEKYSQKGIIPIFTTFPQIWEDNDPYFVGKTEEQRWIDSPTNSLRFNIAICRLCQEYGIPLINLLRGSRETLPQAGARFDQQKQRLDPFHYSSDIGIPYVEKMILQTLSRIPVPSGLI